MFTVPGKAVIYLKLTFNRGTQNFLKIKLYNVKPF